MVQDISSFGGSRPDQHVSRVGIILYLKMEGIFCMMWKAYIKLFIKGKVSKALFNNHGQWWEIL